MSPADALARIIQMRDAHAEYGRYPPGGPDADQCFDDWAADLAAKALAGCLATPHRQLLAAQAALDAYVASAFRGVVVAAHVVPQGTNPDGNPRFDLAVLWTKDSASNTHRGDVVLQPTGKASVSLYWGHYGIPKERVAVHYAARARDVRT